LVFAFLVPAYLGSPGQRAIKRVCVCVCVCVLVSTKVAMCLCLSKMDGSVEVVFLNGGFLLLLHCVIRKLKHLKGSTLWNFVPYSGLGKFHQGTRSLRPVVGRTHRWLSFVDHNGSGHRTVDRRSCYIFVVATHIVCHLSLNRNAEHRV